VGKRVLVFSDEAGCLTFKPPGNGVSRYFMIGTVTMTDCTVGDELLRLRRELAWTGLQLNQFHATTDKPKIRKRVFSVIAGAPLRYDVTILDKRKTYGYVREDAVYFYKLAWHLHFKYVAPQIVSSNDELLVVASSLQINRKRKVVYDAVQDVVAQASPAVTFHTAFAPTMSDPCLQAADYLAWAVQRKYEAGDTGSYDLVRHLVRTEFQPYLRGKLQY